MMMVVVVVGAVSRCDNGVWIDFLMVWIAWADTHTAATDCAMHMYRVLCNIMQTTEQVLLVSSLPMPYRSHSNRP